MTSLCDTLKSMAAKLQVTEEEAILLYVGYIDLSRAVLRMQVGDVVDQIIARFALKDSPFEKGLGAQLFEKGLLTREEAELFSTGRIPPEIAK